MVSRLVDATHIGSSGNSARARIANVRNVPLIAIVDDSISMREALFGLVSSLGHQAELFETADQFLASVDSQLFDCQVFDCVILDVAMPGRSGIELQAELNKRRSPPPIIFVTSRNDEATKTAALVGGAICFLGKPVDDTELISCLQSALRQRSSNR
jgi:FixJ family two-component response regulator